MQSNKSKLTAIWIKEDTLKLYENVMAEWTKYIKIRNNDLFIKLLLELAAKAQLQDIITAGKDIVVKDMVVK